MESLRTVFQEKRSIRFIKIITTTWYKNSILIISVLLMFVNIHLWEGILSNRLVAMLWGLLSSLGLSCFCNSSFLISLLLELPMLFPSLLVFPCLHTPTNTLKEGKETCSTVSWQEFSSLRNISWILQDVSPVSKGTTTSGISFFSSFQESLPTTLLVSLWLRLLRLFLNKWELLRIWQFQELEGWVL